MKFVLPLVFIASLILGYRIVLGLPYHFYSEAIESGISSKFLELPKLPKSMYEAHSYKLEKMDGVASEAPKYWKELHFNDFIIPFPIKHPSFQVVPIIERKAGHYQFGYKMVDYLGNELNRVLFFKDQRFTLELHEHKIFELPMFKNRITHSGLQGVWKDIFKKNFNHSEHLNEYSRFSWDMSDIPLTQMVYDLFVLYSRERFLPRQIFDIAYWSKREMGIVEFPIVSDEEGLAQKMRREMIYILVEDQVYRIELFTKLENYPAESYRQKFLRTVTVKDSHKDSSIGLYAQFKGLSYKEKLTPTGMTYLYAAYSHQKDSRQFLREIIQFLERGANERILLGPLYEYGFNRFGTNFSKDAKTRKETANEKLLRKIREDEQKRRKALFSEDFVEENESFENDEEKIQFYLQKAKDSGKNFDINDKRIIID